MLLKNGFDDDMVIDSGENESFVICVDANQQLHVNYRYVK